MTFHEEGHSLKFIPLGSIYISHTEKSYYLVNKYFIVDLKSCFNGNKLETRMKKIFCTTFFHVLSRCLLSVFDWTNRQIYNNRPFS